MNRSKHVLRLIAVCAVLAALRPAFADAPCGEGQHMSSAGSCVSDVKTMPYAVNSVSEFGTAAPGASTNTSAPQDVHKAKSDFEAQAEMEKARLDYLQNKQKADQLDNQMKPSSAQRAPDVAIPLYLTMISGTDDDLTGTVIYNNQIWRVKNGTTIGSGVIITEIHKTYAVANVNGKVQLLGLSSLGAIQTAQQQRSGATSPFAGQPAVELGPNYSLPPPQGAPVNASDLPPSSPP